MNTTQNQNTGQDGRAGSTSPQAGNGDAIRQGTQELKQGTEELRSKATEVAKDATREGQAQVEEYRKVAARKVDTIAESVKAAAAKLQEGDVGQWSSQVSGMADSMSRFSQGLREKSPDALMHDMNRLARENPAIFVGGAVAIGFGLTRLMRATAQPRQTGETEPSRRASDTSTGFSNAGDDAYTSSTITGSADPRLTGAAQRSGYGSAGAGSGGSTGAPSNSYSSGGSSAASGSASSPSGQSSFSGASGNQGNATPQPGNNRLGDNDRSKSS